MAFLIWKFFAKRYGFHLGTKELIQHQLKNPSTDNSSLKESESTEQESTMKSHNHCKQQRYFAKRSFLRKWTMSTTSDTSEASNMDIMLTVLSIDKEVSDSRDVTNVKSENICTTEIDSSNDEFKCMESIEENSSASEEEEESLIKIICPLAQDEIAICDEAEKSSNNHDILETINSQKEVVILESNSQSDLCLKVTETPDEQLCTEEPLSLRPTPCNVHDSLNGNVVIQDNMARDNLTLSRASSYQEPMLSNTSPNANVFLSSSSSPSTPSSFGSSKRHSMDPLSFAPQFWPSTPSPILPSPPSTCSERCDEVVCVTMASSSLAFSTASGCPDVESHNKTLKTQIDNCVSAVSDNCCKSTPVTSTKQQIVVTGGISQLVDETLGGLYEPFEDSLRRELVRQSRDILVCNYLGNLNQFHSDFLIPATALLKRFKEKERVYMQDYLNRKLRHNVKTSDLKKSDLLPQKPLLEVEFQTCIRCRGWPLSLEGDKIVVRLGEIEPSLLRTGDYYVFVRPTYPGAELVLKYCKPHSSSSKVSSSNCLKEHVIRDSEFGKVFSMEGPNMGPSTLMTDALSDEQMTALLQHMLVSVEKGIKRMNWELQQTSQQWAKMIPPSSITECLSLTSRSSMDTLCSQSSCCCCGLHSVDVKDSGVQTSPTDEHKDGSSFPTLSSSSSSLSPAGVKNDKLSSTLRSTSSCGSSGIDDDLCNSVPDGNDGDNKESTILKYSKDCVLQTSSVLPESKISMTKQAEDTKMMSSCGQTDSSINLTSSPLVESANQDPSEVATKESVQWDAGVAPSNEDPDDGYHDNSLIQPSSIFQVCEDVVKSQVALIPGCRDRTGRVIVIIDCNVLQGCNLVTAPQLAQLLMYYYAVPRKELTARGFLIFVDARSALKDSLSILDESFSLLEANIPGAVNTVVFWKTSTGISGSETFNKKITSPFPQSGVKFETVHSIEEVRKVIKSDQLLEIFGGEYIYEHEKWVEFRKKLEPFMQSCRSVGKRMIGIMQEMKGSCLPSSALQTTQCIEQHKKFVGQVFDDPLLVQLQQTGPDLLREFEEIRRQSPNNHDFRESIERCSALYSELQRAIVKLVRLADKRLKKLEQCLQLRNLEEETTQVLSWLSKKGEESLIKHRIVANSLGGVKAQERDFEKFYFLAMRHIDKGNDLLEEAATLEQKGNPDAVAMKDLAKSLKQHLSSFSTRLEDQREKLEDTSKCYQLLDKAYEWALEAMKFVSRLKMDQYSSPDQLLCLMKHLHRYLDSHPTLGEETFTEMIELAKKLENERLLEQCKVAQVRCRETAELLRARQQTLMKAKQQFETDSVRQRPHSTVEQVLDQVSEVMCAYSPKVYQSTSPLWTPSFSTSTPYYPYARRRSVSGMPYSLVSSPYSYFGVSVTPGHKRHNSLGANMLISEEQDENCDPMDNGGSLSPDIPITADDTPDLAQVHCKDECPGTSAESSVDGENVGISEKTENENDGMNLTISSPASLSQSQVNKLMKRSQTWQFEDDVWDVLPPRPSCGLGQLTKNPVTGGSAESIPSITENEDHSSKLGAGYPPVPVNTHLHQRGSSLNLQFSATSMADLRQTDDQLKQRRTVLLIMREMIQTERDYVKSLEYIIENYIPELLRDDIPQALRGKRNVIFGNIEKIYEFHNRYFLHELEQCDNFPSQVGQCFLRHESCFYLYALYNKNKPNSDSLMAEYGSVFFKSKQLELGDKMDLASYLLKPVQRMGKYALLLKQLLKECSEKDPEYGTLVASKEMVNFQLRHGNDLLAMDAIRECDVNLKEQGCLLRQDEFLVWQGKSRKCLRQVFLFEELILFSKARRDPIKKGHDIYQYKHSMKMTDIGLTEQLGESNTKFEIWFRKRKLPDTFTLQAPNPEIRQAWIQEISKLLWKQALRNREVRLAEMSSMGIGNKPCLDIKPSRDQINDRSISIAQLYKGIKLRNSISVTSSEYLRTNKRPHSIISVSSSSSGSSSNSSSGPYFGALNLGFDPNDSPKSRHRSITQQSQCSSESGIVTDISLTYDSLTDCESHKKVERSNSNTSSESIGICSLPMTPSTPSSPEEDAGIGAEGQ